ncbi:MAG: DUF2064 domain-containing protein [Candidatus Zixiibacteriota bacterium]|nr:MAG: DUF2064 domain-containing protein [candidate division Zixibacteria bacterium]
MGEKKKRNSVIAICIQEPQEDGSSMDFGPIQGDNLRFLHQAFITDTIVNASVVENADIKLYHIDQPDRKKLVRIVTDYLMNRSQGKKGDQFKSRFQTVELEKQRWGIRIEEVFKDCFAQGYKHVLVAGSRTPTIRPAMFETALKMLSESDAVFGPTPEGRYYVIGMSGSYKINLADFDWKSPAIYSEVAEAFTQKNLEWSELEIWYCVENTEEIEMMIRDINQFRYEGDEQTARETEKVLERILTRLEP